MSARDQRALFYKFVGTIWKTKVFWNSERNIIAKTKKKKIKGIDGRVPSGVEPVS